MRMPMMKQISWYLVCAMFVIGIAPRVDAAFAPSEYLSPAPVDRAGDMERVRQALESKMVGERLSKFGLSSDEVQSRLDGLDDQQLHNLALQLDDLRIGSDDALGVILALLLIGVLVVLLLQLTGHRVIVR